MSNFSPIQQTTDEAVSSKLSASSKGYYEDKFIHFFTCKQHSRAPLINRGYFARVQSLRVVLSNFLGGLPENIEDVQLLGIGAGLDTLSLWALGQSRKWRCYDVDFDDVIARKAETIRRNPELEKSISELAGQITIEQRNPFVSSNRLKMIGADLAKTENLKLALRDAGFNFGTPTLIVAECVLIYMQPREADTVIQWCAESLSSWKALVVYEQINPSDAFGEVMVRNFEARGCPLRGFELYKDFGDLANRFSALGWGRGVALEMNLVYEHLIEKRDLQRVSNIEIFDEFEEWILMQSHYAVSILLGDPPSTKGSLSLSQGEKRRGVFWGLDSGDSSHPLTSLVKRLGGLKQVQ